MIKQAVIFAGGRGERLRPFTDNMPKPMVSICGYPFLDYLFAVLKKAGIKRFLVLVGYKADVIMDHYGDGKKYSISVDYSVGTVEDLTGRRLAKAYSKLDDHFLLLYGDNYWPIPLNDMITNYNRLGAAVTTTVFRNKNGTGEYGFENNIFVSDKGMVNCYDKTRCSQSLNGVDMGFFIVDKKVINPSDLENFSFEEKTLTRLADERSLGAFMTDEQYYFITSIESLRRFEHVVSERGYSKIEQKGTK